MSILETDIGQRWNRQRQRLGLPESATRLLDQLHLPFTESLQRWHQRKSGPVVVGLQGCQGAGKSTLCDLVVPLAKELFDLKVVVVALDDVYLPLQQRQHLADQDHPLWITRGVPGTHDTELAIEIIRALSDPHGKTATIPRFDKGIDDRLPGSMSSTLSGPFDVVIFEGWCTGLGPCSQFDWETPVNRLEQIEDAEMGWRNRIRDQLAGPYQQLFQQFDQLAMLKVPSWETVAVWRGQQEARLRADRGHDASHSMDAAALQRFLDHYERLTRWTIETLPAVADFVADIAEDRSIVSIQTDLQTR
ncbi:MAG: kinase [Planctomycetota bacterium]|nr:kinase [Planctomycetota bacterium]